MRRNPTSRPRTTGRLERGLREQQGSMLVEVMISAVIVLIVGFGVLEMVDRTNDLSGEQRSQVIAGNLAQVEIDTVRAMPLAQLSNLRRETTQTVSDVDYTITTRADWINDTAMSPECTTPGATADYLKVRTTVTHPGLGSRGPAVLDTIVAPHVRAFNADEGSLAIKVTDRDSVPIPGLTVSLTGPQTLTDVTNANGCILWGYLPAGSDYTVAFSKAGYMTEDGGPGGGPATVTGDATTNLNYLYDRGGSIKTNFKVKNTAGTSVDTFPKLVRVDNGTGAGVSKTYDIGSTSSLNTLSSGLLFPYANPYSIYADSCEAAKPPAPTSAALTPGGVIQAADTVLPALDITVRRGSSVYVGGAVRVVTACGTVHGPRTSIALGKLADRDRGFPYGASGFTLCATDGVRKTVQTDKSNALFTNAGTPYTLTIPTSGTTPNPNSCP